MRVRCHGCKSGWEFPDESPVARCPSCRILAVARRHQSLIGVAETSEPSDHQILGLPFDARGTRLAEAWAAFLAQIPFDRFPSAFRQGRLAFDRLNAEVESDRVLWRWPIAGRCLACDESERLGFRACILCRGTLSPTGGASRTSAARALLMPPRVAESLLDAESHWSAGRGEELLLAAERGLADRGAEDDAVARLELLAGHAFASLGSYAEAGERWSRASAHRREAAEARFCLAAFAYRRNVAEEVLHHAGNGMPSETMILLAGSALAGIGRADEAIARIEALFDSKSRLVVARARWAVAATEYAGGNPAGVFPHLRVTISILTGRRDEPGLVESLAPVEIAKLHSHMIWLCGVTFSALGNGALAEEWLALGQQLAPSDASFPRERGTIALRAKDFDRARELFAEAEKRGDAKGASRGRAVADWLAAGQFDAAPLLAAAETLQDPILFYHAGRQLERAGDTEAAAKAYTRATVLDPLMGRAFASLGVLSARSGDGERAIGALTRARVAGERGTMVFRALATLLLERGRVDEAIPLLEEIIQRSPDDEPALRNLAGAKRLLALRCANEEKEEEALEYLGEAATADPGTAEAWKQVVAEVGFRAAARVSMLRPSGWTMRAAELLDSAARRDPSNLRIRLRLGVVRLAAALADRDDAGGLPAEAVRGAISTLHSIATSPSVAGQLRLSAELHRAIALHAAGATKEADEITALLTRHPALDAESRLRARWVQAVSLARARRNLPARVLLEESARECEELLVAADLLKLVRLQILKLEADERGAQRLEREANALEPGARNATTLLLHGLVLASRSRFDDAGEALEAASRDPSIRREANTARTMMQLKRVADLLMQKREAEAHKLLGRLRPSLPPDAEIDRWLNALEVEGVPLAALRQGDARSAMAIWSSRAQRFRQKDAEYWELARSIAIAAHLAAVRAERSVDQSGAEECWKIAVTRWLELLDAEEYWQAFARRGQDLFPGLDPGIVDEVRHDLVERRLVGTIREVIERERRMGDDLVAIQRLSLIEQIESWRLARTPEDGGAKRNLVRCHSQRTLLASKLGRWDEAIAFGEKACETDPSDPALFNDIAELYLAQIQSILACSGASDGQATRVVELASLALAWNPHHPTLLELVARMAPEADWAEVSQSDSRVRKAEALRGKLPPGALERYIDSLASVEASPPQAAPPPESGSEADEGGQDIEYADFDAVAMMDLVTNLKAKGLSHDAIYAALLDEIPELATRDKQVVMMNIEAI